MKHISYDAAPGVLPGGERVEIAALSARPFPERQTSRTTLRKLRDLAFGLLDDAATTLFPADCRVCAQPLTDAGVVPVCAECLAAPQPQTGTLCARCGERIEPDYENDRFQIKRAAAEPCELCRKAPPPFTQAVAYGSYEGTLRELLHLLKYEGVTALAQPLGGWLAESFGLLGAFAGEPEREWIVAPVPLARAKRRGRGFNQALLLAQAAVRQARPAALRRRLVLRPELLQRVRQTESQFGLTPHERRENLRGAFAVADAAEVRGRSVLLVDDIYTTGATARACSAVLGRAGAREVVVATLARAQTPAVALWDGAVGATTGFHGEEDGDAWRNTEVRQAYLSG